MPYYYVNKNAQSNGDHEVHEDGACSYPPDTANRYDVGWHSDCRSAVTEANKTYSPANGCLLLL